MKMTVFKIISGAFIIVFGLCLIYFSHISTQIFPADTAPSENIYPETARELLRLSFASEQHSQSDAYFRVVSHGARILLSRKDHEKLAALQNDWTQNFVMASLWVFMNWRENEILNTILDESLFEQEWRGMNNAARGFFDMEASALTTEELAVLIVNIKSNSRYNPWCNREVTQIAVKKLLETYKNQHQTAPPVNSSSVFTRLKPRFVECPQGGNITRK